MEDFVNEVRFFLREVLTTFFKLIEVKYKAPIVLLRLGDIPVRLCCMEILMSMLRS